MAQQAGGDDVRIDVDVLSTDLQNMMSENLHMSPKRCIFRVPKILSRHNPKAYAPNAFSIGPFHYNNPDLKATQRIKLEYLHGLISRFPNPETKLRELMESISEIQEEALECYEGSIGMRTDEFVKVLVLDGCFLIELFRKREYEDLIGEDDSVFTMSCMPGLLSHDLILLENQIPWLVLARLFNMTKTPEDEASLNQLVILFFDKIFSSRVTLDQEKVHESLLSENHENKHILDLLRNSVVFSSSVKDHRSWYWMEGWQPMPSITSLQEAGIEFQEATAASILDITFNFKDGILKIPPLFIHEITEPLFRNLICLEQCLPNCKEVITSYAMLLDNLINTSKDVEILCKSKVIDNWLSNVEAAKFFNQLYNDTCFSDFYYVKLKKDVNKYCQRHWPRYRTVLMRDYFKHPWALISVIVAAILLILTFLQTLYAIIE